MLISEILRRYYMIIGLSYGSPLDMLAVRVKESLEEKLLDADDASVKRKTLEVLEFFLESGQFEIEIYKKRSAGEMELQSLNLSSDEILSKIRDALDSGKKVEDLFSQTWVFLSEKGIEVAKGYYTKALDLNEKVSIEIDKIGPLNFKEVADITAKDFNTDDSEEIKYETVDVVENSDLEIGFLRKGVFEKCESEGCFDFKEMSLEKWEELLEEKDPEKKLWIRNTEETKKRIQEWRKNGSKGKIFPEWYESEGLL